jgi:type III pantothenate kinase
MLLFDVGNSRCKWAWTENGLWLRQGVLGNNDSAAWQQLKASFAQFAAPHKILVSNVAGAALEQNVNELCSGWSCAVEYIRAQAEQCGVHNSYEQFAQLGSDRWAALIAAWHHAGRACLVVNCGTATTVDALSGQGEFLGGLILPGMELMQRSLLQHTAQLDWEMGEPRNFPRNTADAMVSGVIRATAGAVQYQYNLLASQGNVHCMVSGGAANALLPFLNLEAEQVDNLVLQGMQIIGQGC